MQKFRYQEMKSVQENARNEYENSFLPLYNMEKKDALAHFSILSDRFYGTEPTVRSHFAFLFYNFFSQGCSSLPDNKPLQKYGKYQLPLLLEIVISIQYYHNHILDNKFGVTNIEDKNNHLIKANLIRSALDQYIETKIPPEYRTLTRTFISDMFTYVDIGQSLEKKTCSYQNWKQKATPSHPYSKIISNFIDNSFLHEYINIVFTIDSDMPEESINMIMNYFTRIYFTNAALYILTVKLLGDVMKVKNIDWAIGFATNFGIMRQVINDINDLVPSWAKLGTRTRLSIDAFSDIRNGNITLPVLLHINKFPEGKIASYLSCPQEWTPEIEKEINHEFNTIAKCFNAMRIARRIRSMALLNMNNGISSNIIETLKDMCNIANTNKFYRFFEKTPGFKKFKREVKKSLSNQCIESSPPKLNVAEMLKNAA